MRIDKDYLANAVAEAIVDDLRHGGDRLINDDNLDVEIQFKASDDGLIHITRFDEEAGVDYETILRVKVEVVDQRDLTTDS